MRVQPALVASFAIGLLVSGCGQSAQDSRSSGPGAATAGPVLPAPAPGPQPSSYVSLPDTVRIVSISPPVEAPFRPGQRVELSVEVEYTLNTTASGTVSLVVQEGTSGRPPLFGGTEVIHKGTGRKTFRAAITIPETSAVLVFTPLTIQGQSATGIVDTRAYQVSAP